MQHRETLMTSATRWHWLVSPTRHDICCKLQYHTAPNRGGQEFPLGSAPALPWSLHADSAPHSPRLRVHWWVQCRPGCRRPRSELRRLQPPGQPSHRPGPCHPLQWQSHGPCPRLPHRFDQWSPSLLLTVAVWFGGKRAQCTTGPALCIHTAGCCAASSGPGRCASGAALCTVGLHCGGCVKPCVADACARPAAHLPILSCTLGACELPMQAFSLPA